MGELMKMGHDARAAIGAAGRRHVIANYSLESVVGQWEHLYLELMANTVTRCDKGCFAADFRCISSRSRKFLSSFFVGSLCVSSKT